MNLTSWLTAAIGLVGATPAPALGSRKEPAIQTPSARLRVAPEALARARANTAPFELYTTRQLHPQDARALFPPARPPAGVVPTGAQPMAMDEDFSGFYADPGLGGSTYSEGMHWLGTPYLAELAQRAEYRQISETYARDMTRAWIKIQASGEEDKGDRIKEIERAFDRHKIQHKFRRMAELDGFFGRAHLYVDMGVPMTDADLMRTAIILDRRTVKKGSLRNIQVVEPLWTYPGSYDAVNPLAPDFYVPVTWYVMGREVHRTRLLTFVGREVPDLLKPSYAFGGLSMSQMAKPYVDNWLRTRQSVSDLIHSFSVFALATDMSGTLTGGAGADERARADLFTLYRDNSGLFLYDKNREDFKNISASLGTLDHLQAQSQEHICSVSGIPLVVFTGITPTGLNTTSEGELQAWAQRVHAAQENLFGDHLRFLLRLVQLDLFGEIDEEITATFEPLKEESETERSTRLKTEADADAAYVSMGALAPDDVRQVLAEQEAGRYAAVDLSGPPPDPPGMGADPLGAGPGAGGGGFGGPGGGGSSGPPGGAAGGAPQPRGGGAGGGEDEDAWAAADRLALDDEKFEEADHPRDESGKFAKNAGGAAAAMEHHKGKVAQYQKGGEEVGMVRRPNARALKHYAAAHEHYTAGNVEAGHAAHAEAEMHAGVAAQREKRYIAAGKLPGGAVAEAKTPEAKTPEAKTPEAKTPEAKTPEAKTPEAKTPEKPEEAAVQFYRKKYEKEREAQLKMQAILGEAGGKNERAAGPARQFKVIATPEVFEEYLEPMFNNWHLFKESDQEKISKKAAEIAAGDLSPMPGSSNSISMLNYVLSRAPSNEGAIIPAHREMQEKLSEIPHFQAEQVSEYEDASGQKIRAVLKTDTSKISGNQFAKVTAAYGGKQDKANTFAVDAAMQDYRQVVAAHLAPEEKQVLRDYKGEGYASVNRYLSGKKALLDRPEEARGFVGILDNAMQKNVVPADTPVYRGLSVGLKALTGFDDPEQAVGKAFVHTSYASTSRDRKFALGFNTDRDKKTTMMKFTVPAGSSGIVLGDQVAGSEKEIVLPRNGVFRIDQVEAIAKGTVLHVTYLGTKKDE
jgi:phage-related protein (TIGR01555 family)